MTCSISRATFSSAATITGATNICSGTSTYPISGILPGQTVAWSLSNPSIATLSGQTNSQTNVTFNGNGTQTLNATITNTCGQSVVKTFVINTGATTFTSTATLEGASIACLSANIYTITGVVAGQNVTWSLSNPSIATLSGNTPNTQITVNSIGVGPETLTATITNSCGQSATKTIDFWIGQPTLPKLLTYSNIPYDQFQLNSPYWNPVWYFSTNSPLDQVTEFVFKNLSDNIIVSKLPINGQVSISANELNIGYGQTLSFYVYPKNNCGMLVPYKKAMVKFTLYCPTLCEYGIGTGCHLARMAAHNNHLYQVYPNPSKDIINIELNDINNQTTKSKTYTGELFDMMGQSKTKVQINDNKTTLSVRELNKGIYVLKIYLNDQTETHQIIIE